MPTMPMQEEPMREWKPMDSAPRDGTHIYLRNKEFGCVALMFWATEDRRWEGLEFGIMGPLCTYWDETIAAPDDWSHVGDGQPTNPPPP